MSDLAEPEDADVVGLLQAHLRGEGEEEAVQLLLAQVNPYALLAQTVGWLTQWMENRGVLADLEEDLAKWQRDRLD